MRPFKFRADAALEMRRQQDEEAQGALGAAATAMRDAEAALRASERLAVDAGNRAREAEMAGCDMTALTWHRNWMVRQRADIAAHRDTVERRRADVARATTAAHDARRRFRALEALKERAWEDYLRDERRAEQKELDRLATMQYARSAGRARSEWPSDSTDQEEQRGHEFDQSR